MSVAAAQLGRGNVDSGAAVPPVCGLRPCGAEAAASQEGTRMVV